MFASAALFVHAARPLARWPGDPGTRFTEGRVLAEVVAREVLPEGVGPWEPRAEQVADAARRVADRVALVGRRHPLVDDHRAGSSSGRAWKAAGRVERTSSSHSA